METFTGFEDVADELDIAPSDAETRDDATGLSEGGSTELEDVDGVDGSAEDGLDQVEASPGANATPNMVEGVAGRHDETTAVHEIPSEDHDAASGNQRRSKRESHQPERYQYFKLGGDPMVTNDPVGNIEIADVLTTNTISTS